MFATIAFQLPARSLHPRISRQLRVCAFAVGATKYALAVAVLTLTLFAFHRFLPDGARSIRTTFPGIALTISGIIVGSQLFALYLQTIANYTALYAGLAGTMVAIVYLYGLSALILFGAEFNAALAEERRTGSQET